MIYTQGYSPFYDRLHKLIDRFNGPNTERYFITASRRMYCKIQLEFIIIYISSDLQRNVHLGSLIVWVKFIHFPRFSDRLPAPNAHFRMYTSAFDKRDNGNVFIHLIVNMEISLFEQKHNEQCFVLKKEK